MSWYIWGVTSFDVPLLLDQSLICMKFSRYILTVLSVIRKLKAFWTLWPLVNPAFILTVLPSVMGGTHSVPLYSNDPCGWGFLGDFRIHHFLFLIRQPPALPCRLQHSTIGRSGLNHRVRDGNGCVPWAHRHRKYIVIHRTAPLFSWLLRFHFVSSQESQSPNPSSHSCVHANKFASHMSAHPGSARW